MRPGIYHRDQANYDAIDAVNISSLLWIAKSPKHYQCRPRVATKAMSLGNAAHSATLEPERFVRDYAVWDRRGESGKLCPRNGQYWDSFRALNPGCEIITAEEQRVALDIATAVRSDTQCSEVLSSGAPEMILVWRHERTGILCRGRVDWLDIARMMFADLKTAADITTGPFLQKSAKLAYHVRMAWYHDALAQLLGVESLETLIVAVESGKPHDCAVYWLDDEVLATGRTEYERLMDRLKEATDSGNWTGISDGARIRYTLPRWAVDDPEDEKDDDLDWGKR